MRYVLAFFMPAFPGPNYTPINFLVLILALSIPALGQTPAKKDGYVGSESCAHCHSPIYESYKRTAMARASGPATEALAPGEFTHKPSGVHYRIYSEGGNAWLSFERPGDSSVRGKKQLLYYIGSGRRGRSYLFETDGFLFESPVNWYTDAHMWDMTPGYQAAREMPLNLPAYTGCLHCHVSGMQSPIEGTSNHYPKPAFTRNGIDCERCHGPGAAHVNGGAIVNPAKLPPARRDEVGDPGSEPIALVGLEPGSTNGAHIRLFGRDRHSATNSSRRAWTIAEPSAALARDENELRGHECTLAAVMR